MGALFGFHCLGVFELVAVEDADDAGVAEGYIQATKVGVVPDDVGHAWEGEGVQECSVVGVEDGECSSVRGAEQASAVEPESVGPGLGTLIERVISSCWQSMTTMTAGSATV